MLLYLLITLAQIAFIFRVHDTGLLLSVLGNLPHRSLGMLWASHLMMPWREDYAADYLSQWTYLDEKEFLLEGQTRPVVPAYACKVAVDFPRDEKIRKLKERMIRNERKKGQQ